MIIGLQLMIINLSIIFSINRLVVWSIKYHIGQKKPENIHIWEDDIREFGHFFLKNYSKQLMIIKIVGD